MTEPLYDEPPRYPWDDIVDITDLVDAAAEKMRAAARDLEAAAAAARAAGAPAWFPGQLEAYTIPILRRFADRGDPGQPGNLPRLLANLQGDDDAP
jgi:hypothetical protein